MDAARQLDPACVVSGGGSRAISRRARAIGGTVARTLSVLCATWRVGVSGLERFDQALLEGRRALVVFWHGKYVPMFAILRDRRACIFSSESERGSAIATICRHFGYACVRLPDGGRDESLLRMEEALREYSLTGLAADGPLGPFHKVKRGPIVLASRLGYEIFPMSFAARPCFVAKARWDQMELPSPFARVQLAVGTPFAVPRDIERDADALTAWCHVLGEALDAVDVSARNELDAL